MSTGAVMMMTIAIVLVWGGLGVAVTHWRRHPERPGEKTPPDPGAH